MYSVFGVNLPVHLLAQTHTIHLDFLFHLFHLFHLLQSVHQGLPRVPQFVFRTTRARRMCADSPNA